MCPSYMYFTPCIPRPYPWARCPQSQGPFLWWRPRQWVDWVPSLHAWDTDPVSLPAGSHLRTFCPWGEPAVPWPASTSPCFQESSGAANGGALIWLGSTYFSGNFRDALSPTVRYLKNSSSGRKMFGGTFSNPAALET